MLMKFVLLFVLIREMDNSPLPTFAQTELASVKHWADFWQGGGAIDLSESKDPRWKELKEELCSRSI